MDAPLRNPHLDHPRLDVVHPRRLRHGPDDARPHPPRRLQPGATLGLRRLADDRHLPPRDHPPERAEPSRPRPPPQTRRTPPRRRRRTNAHGPPPGHAREENREAQKEKENPPRPQTSKTARARRFFRKGVTPTA